MSIVAPIDLKIQYELNKTHYFMAQPTINKIRNFNQINNNFNDKLNTMKVSLYFNLDIKI